ncbi:GCN5-related N-acetyltransferase [Catenulispora acidiphila DSM 44928]|uniref:GCN5-related N-acetyltransferase n=1 Tax=Catenulispora acidiphila (strain DSM 44928 / JCM 14897 / NBRC 102108 / NRRL B-24433 / ID139908) TaxID=479433 RepID=C7QC66_CATAD|nr:GNAT family N-acetyltransferase [Catenulispora acidiphila]ACU74514.1 GCN5-related N-acetyltransferase [Catenulispora acidiphila DSM 44928]
MSSDLTFRSARPDETDALTELVMRSKAHWGYSEEFMESCRAELTIHPDQIAPSRITVAEAGGLVVAVASLEGEPPHGELGSLFVDPDRIGKGVGRALFRHMADVARGVGIRTLMLDADPHAEPFYEAMGCVRVGVVPSGSIPGRTLNRYAFDL